MAKRRKKNDGSAELASAFAIIIVAAIFLVKWAYELIVFIIKLIARFIEWICGKKQQKSKKVQINNIIDSSFSNTKITPTEEIDINTIKESLCLFDKSQYNDLFEPQIIRRGEIYFSQNKIEDINCKENKYSCKIKGTDTYNVSIEFDENNKIISSKCSCPYYKDKEKNCKHIYALLLKAKCDENPNIIISEIIKYKDNICKVLDDTRTFINNNGANISEDEIDSFNYVFNTYKSKCERYIQGTEKYKYDEDTLIDILKNEIKDSVSLKEASKKVMSSTNLNNKKTTTTSIKNTTQNSDGISFGDVATGLFLTNEIDKHHNQEDEDYDEEFENQMDAYELEDWQKDLVRKGDYDPWNFEEDGDLEEDDYYYEDDK